MSFSRFRSFSESYLLLTVVSSVVLLFTWGAQPAPAQELIEDALIVDDVSIGTYHRVQAGGALAEEEAVGMNVYVSVRPTDDRYSLSRPLQLRLRQPDDSEERIRQNFVGDGWTRVWMSNSVSEQAGEKSEDALRPAPGPYAFTIAVAVEEEDVGLTADTTFELSEQEARERLTPTPPDGVDYEVHDDGITVEWEPVEGAASYHVQFRTDDRRSFEVVTTEPRHTFKEAEAAPDRIGIDAYSAPPRDGFEGTIETPPVQLQGGEALHRARTSIEWE